MKNNDKSGIDWDLTRTIAAIQMGMPGAFPGMPKYPDPFEEDEEDEEEYDYSS